MADVRRVDGHVGHRMNMQFDGRSPLPIADSARVAGLGDLALARRSARPLEPLPVAHEGMRCAARYVRPRRVI